MGARFSCKASEKGVNLLSKIRVVHLDGSLEDYEDPATVDQVTSNFPKHFLCTPLEILQSGLVPLRVDHKLKPGQIYFMLPNSTLKFNASPVDLSSLTKKLLNIAKTRQSSAKSNPTTPLATPLRSPQATNSPRQYLDHWFGEIGEGSMLRSERWKPLLAAIIEA